MKKYFFLIPVLMLTAFLLKGNAAEEKAIVNEPRVNVRGQPSFFGEVVTQLKEGDEVTVLERIPVPPEKQKPNEPTNWAKIKMPANTPVWAFAAFIKDGKVVVSRLNLRAGAGENYSVVGRLEKDAEVKEIRTENEWMEIEPPDTAYAFMDASLLRSLGPATPDAAAVAAATPAVTAPSTPAPTETTPPATTEPVVIKPEAVARAEDTPPTRAAAIPSPSEESRPLTAETVTPQPQVAPTQPTAQPSPPPVVVPPPVSQPQVPETTAQREPAPGKPLPKRIVRREGIVRSTRSIQAPTYYELIHPQTKKTMNYLHAAPVGINLKQFRGQRVIVTGEEGVDARWPEVPVIEVDTVDSAP